MTEERKAQRSDNDAGEEPPRRDAGIGQKRGEGEADHHADRNKGIVADDELVDESESGAEPCHEVDPGTTASAARWRRRS